MQLYHAKSNNIEKQSQYDFISCSLTISHNVTLYFDSYMTLYLAIVYIL